MAEKKLYKSGEGPDSDVQKALEKFKREASWYLGEDDSDSVEDDGDSVRPSEHVDPNMSSDLIII